MCIGLPMQVLATEPGFATCAGRGGEQRRVRTALVGAVAPGDWLLIFIDSAQEHISAERAAEVNATLDLLQAANSGHTLDPFADVGFELPSRWSTAELQALSTGAPTNAPTTATETPP
jgi:hydrogenase expression/formation protein HypC